MNENLNLVKVLKECPKGTKLYSPIFGEVKLCGVKTAKCNDKDYTHILIESVGKHKAFWGFSSDGKYFLSDTAGECMLFPSKDQRDWSKFNPNIKPKFMVGDRIVDVELDNNIVCEVLEVLEDRYKVTGFDTLLFCDQDKFELSPVQIEMLEPQKVYWFVWEGGVTEPLLDELMTLSDSGYRPCALKDGEIVFNVADEILVRSHRDTGAMLAIMFGTRLSLKLLEHLR